MLIHYKIIYWAGICDFILYRSVFHILYMYVLYFTKLAFSPQFSEKKIAKFVVDVGFFFPLSVDIPNENEGKNE